MELVAGYLCDQLKGFVKAHTERLVLRLRWIWDRLPKTIIRDLVISILANVIYDVLKSVVTSLIFK
jgi:hypothetical protein